ncbi:MAG: PRC-barrel domain-containing protein [Caldilineaceae bacterium]|nr:PRC-barrel domain-containing protein [Caldilineaceae bacterium]
MSRKVISIWCALLAIALVMGACGNDTPEPTATPIAEIVVPTNTPETATEVVPEEATATPEPAPDEPVAESAVRAGIIEGKELIGYTVRNAAGDNIGEVSNAVVDLQNQQILMVTIKFGGFLGLDQRILPAPLNKLSWDESQNVLLLNVPETALEGVDGFPGDWPNLLETAWYDDAQALMGQLDLQSTEQVTAPENLNTLVLLTDLLDRGVSSPEDAGLANIEDVLIDLRSGHLLYAVTSFGGFLGLGQEHFLVPLHAFAVTAVDEGGIEGDLQLDITEEQINSAPKYDYSAIDFLDVDWDVDIRDFWRSLGLEDPQAAHTGDTADEEKGVQTVRAQIFAPDSVAVRLGQAVGATVYGIEGEELGQIKDLLLNLETGTVVYVALIPSGEMTAHSDATGTVTDTATMTTTTETITQTQVVSDSHSMGEYLIPIGADALTWGENGNGFVIHTDYETVLGAPRLQGEDWSAQLNDLTLASDIAAYWSPLAGAATAPLLTPYGNGPFGASVTFRGLPHLLFPASQLIGEPVNAWESGEPIGEIEDIIYSDGSIRYVALSTNAAESSGSRIVPIYTLIYNFETEEVLMDMAMPENASPVNLDELDISQPGWDEGYVQEWDTAGSNAITQPGMRMLAASYILAHQLLGYPVVDMDGTHIGEVNDLVVDRESGAIRYAAIEFGGFLGLGERIFLIPLNQLTFSSFNAWLVANMDEAMLESTPQFGQNEWLDLNIPEWDTDIRTFWHSTGMETRMDEPATGTITNTQPVTDTESAPTGTAIRVSELLQWQVNDANGEAVGHIEDLIVNLLDANVPFAVVQTDQYLDLADESYIVPFQRISATTGEESDGEEVIELDVDAVELEGAPIFDSALWETLVMADFRRDIDVYWGRDMDATQP